MRRLLVILLLVSCSPTKPYKKVAADANVTPKKKAIIAPFVSAHFPVKERIKSDTIIIIDTVYDEKTALVLSQIIDSLIMRKKDTVRNLVVEERLRRQLVEAKKACSRVVTVRQTIKDTIWQEDEAKTFALREYVTKLEHKNGTLTYDLEVADRRVKAANQKANMMTMLFVASILILVLLIYIILRPKR